MLTATAEELPELEAKLAAAEQSEQPLEFEQKEQVDNLEQQPAPTAKVEGEKKPDSLPTDTPATVEKTEAPVVESKKPEPEAGSKYAKDAIRRDTSWKALNEQKTTFQREQEAFKAERESFQRQQEQFKIESAKQTHKFTPEQYETGAQSFLQQANDLDLRAKGLDKQAEEHEENGRYAEAEKSKAEADKMREKAIVQRGQAELAKEQADYIRKNPEPTLEALNAKKQQHRQHYTLEAAKKWPDLVKENSEFQKQVALHLNELQKNEPELAEHPSIIYHAARLTAAESSAARVPGLDKEVGELKAKVKELEALTAPTGGGTSRLPSKVTPASEEEEFESLRAEAAARG